MLPDHSVRVAVLRNVFPSNRAPLHGSRMAHETVAARAGADAIRSAAATILRRIRQENRQKRRHSLARGEVLGPSIAKSHARTSRIALTPSHMHLVFCFTSVCPRSGYFMSMRNVFFIELEKWQGPLRGEASSNAVPSGSRSC